VHAASATLRRPALRERTTPDPDGHSHKPEQKPCAPTPASRLLHVMDKPSKTRPCHNSVVQSWYRQPIHRSVVTQGGYLVTEHVTTRLNLAKPHRVPLASASSAIGPLPHAPSLSHQVTTPLKVTANPKPLPAARPGRGRWARLRIATACHTALVSSHRPNQSPTAERRAKKNAPVALLGPLLASSPTPSTAPTPQRSGDCPVDRDGRT